MRRFPRTSHHSLARRQRQAHRNGRRRWEWPALALVLLTLCGGCLSTNTYQTAQVLPRGEVEFGAALYGNYVDHACFEEGCAQYTTPGGTEDLNSSGQGGAEFVMRVGLGHRMDFGARLGLVGARVDLKAQLIDTRYFDLAVDLGIRADVRAVAATLPLLLSSRPHRWFALFGSVQGLLTRWRINGDGRDHVIAGGVAASFGFALGPVDIVSVRPEVTYHHWLGDIDTPSGMSGADFRYWSFGIAVVSRQF